jgi:NADPH:quinone reductase-like Zn-dependent oxidoreductase
VVTAVGPGVASLAVGQAVTFVGGAFSEYVTAKAAMCWPVPAPTPEAVACAISGSVANAALRGVAGMRAGERVLVTAAAGGTGHFAVQLAALAGCHVVATCGGERKAARLRAAGAHRVIDHTAEVGGWVGR